MAETAPQEMVINLSNVKVTGATYEKLRTSDNAVNAIHALPVARGSRVKIIFEASKHITQSVEDCLRTKYGTCICMWPMRRPNGRSYPPTNQRVIK